MTRKTDRIRTLLEQGLHHHRQGDLRAAESLYCLASESDPRNPDAMNLRGAVAMSTGRTALAVDLFRKATSIQPSNPGFWGNLGNALFEIGNYAESASAYRRASRMAPENPNFAVGIATALAASKQMEEARSILLAVVKQWPNWVAAWFNLGKLAQDTDERQQALEAYQRALEIDPQYANAHLNRGVVLQALFRLDEAELSYRRALACGAPRNAVLGNLISVFSAQGRFDAAEQQALEATAEFPHDPAFFALLAVARVHQGRLDAALAPAMRAAELDPDNTSYRVSVCGIRFETGGQEEGLTDLKKIHDAHPDDPHLAHSLSIVSLTAGDFSGGWQHFIHREVHRNQLQKRPWLKTRLTQNVRGQRVRLIREQGLGDELFFLRFAPVLKALGAEITHVCNPKLESILARLPCFDRVIAEASGEANESPVKPLALSENCMDMLVGDLPHALHHDFAEMCRVLPAPLALSALPQRIDAMRDKLSRLGPPPYLALTWRAGTAPSEQRSKWWLLHKGVDLKKFGETLIGLPCTLIAVQRKPLPGDIEALTMAAQTNVHDFCAVNDDLEDMLALLAIVDDYVGVSNTNMHLRAGLNRGARVLVPRPVEWRWMAYGERSPWFPDFGVYRQKTDGSWGTALQRLRTDLLAALRPAHEL